MQLFLGAMPILRLFSKDKDTYYSQIIPGIPYSGKLSREKTFTNFIALELPVKVFSTIFGRAIPTYDRF